MFRGVTPIEEGRVSRLESQTKRAELFKGETEREWKEALQSQDMRLSELTKEQFGFWRDKGAEGIAENQVEASWLAESQDQEFEASTEKVDMIIRAAVKAGRKPEELPVELEEYFEPRVDELAFSLPKEEIVEMGDVMQEWVDFYGSQDARDEVKDVLAEVAGGADDIDLGGEDIYMEDKLTVERLKNEIQEDDWEEDDVTQESGTFETPYDSLEKELGQVDESQVGDIEFLPDEFVDYNPNTVVEGEGRLRTLLSTFNINEDAFDRVHKNPAKYGLPIKKFKKAAFMTDLKSLFEIRETAREIQSALSAEMNGLSRWKQLMPGLFSKRIRELKAQYGALYVDLKILNKKLEMYRAAFDQAEEEMRAEEGENWIERKEHAG